MAAYVASIDFQSSAVNGIMVPSTAISALEREESMGILREDFRGHVLRELQGGEIPEEVSGREHRHVAAKEELTGKTALHVAQHFLRQIAIAPAGDIEEDVGLVGGRRGGLKGPRPADVGEHDRHLWEGGGGPVEQDRPGEVDAKPQPSRTSCTEAARPGVGDHREACLGGGLKERHCPIARGVKALHGRVELQAEQAEVWEAPHSLDRVGPVGIDGAEADEAVREPLDDAGDELVGEGRPPREGLGVPGQEDADHVELLILGGDVFHGAGRRPPAEVSLGRLEVWPKAAIKPLRHGQMDVEINRGHQSPRVRESTFSSKWTGYRGGLSFWPYYS